MLYTIRPALLEEISALGPLQLEAAKRFSENVLPEPMRSTYTLPLDYLKEALNRNGLWVAEGENGVLAGYAVLRETDGLAFLHQVDVLPAHGRQGLGRSLVEKMLARARELGYEALYLTTFRSVPWNAPFYAKLGFIIPASGELPEPVLSMLAAELAAVPDRVAMCILLS